MALHDTVAVHIRSVDHLIKHVDNVKLRSRLTLVISVMVGPAVFFLCSWMNSDFASGEKLMVLFAFLVIGFESVWMIYCLGALINKAVNNSLDDYPFE